MPALNVFEQDAFCVVSLTDSINKAPFVPGRAGQLIDWNEQPVSTTSIMIEEYAGQLAIINPTGRGGPGSTVAKEARTARLLAIPHYQIDDFVNADEVQNVRAFGSESDVQTVQALVSRRLNDHAMLRMDPTLEFQRIGAIQGIILNGDGSTLYNLFTEFNVSAPGDQAFVLHPTTSNGAVRTKCSAVIRVIAVAMGGTPFTGVNALCGDNFWDALIAAKEVRETYLNQMEASSLRGQSAYQTFDYGGIRWENYRGSNGATPFINADHARFFPTGSPGLWRTVYAPADYVETVNTLGLPRYARQYPAQNGKGVHLEAQMNALNYCTRPTTLVKGTFSLS
jgi:hypothetical protein